jgi:hypothetical protein
MIEFEYRQHLTGYLSSATDDAAPVFASYKHSLDRYRRDGAVCMPSTSSMLNEVHSLCGVEDTLSEVETWSLHYM